VDKRVKGNGVCLESVGLWRQLNVSLAAAARARPRRGGAPAARVLDFTASCANGTRLDPLALAPGLRGGASVVSALARLRCAFARAELSVEQ
jgi:hypothetical protein